MGGVGRVEIGALVSLGPGSGRCKQILGLWSGKLGVCVCGGACGQEVEKWGAGGNLVLMYLEGSWGIKAPLLAAGCVIFGGVRGKAEEGAGMRV